MTRRGARRAMGARILVARIAALALLGALLARCGPAPLAADAPSPYPAPQYRTPGPLDAALTPTPLPSPTDTPSPIPTPAFQPWRFVVLGDTRTSGLKPPQVAYDLIDQARLGRPEVALAVGDLINALTTMPEVREQWRYWREAATALDAGHVLVTPGNHDVSRRKWSASMMVAAFPELPRNGPTGYPLTYALDYRGVRFISLQSESYDEPHRIGAAQLAWLEMQLRDNPSRYTIVFSHDPAYPVGPHVGSSLDVYPAERDQFWRLLREYRATAYIAGHEHLYNHKQIDGVDQIIVGTSGSGIYRGYGGDFFHYLAADVEPDAIAVAVYDRDGKERDRFSLPAR